jgi:photosystem II stability/assembly factor-like uncharacterized protein
VRGLTALLGLALVVAACEPYAIAPSAAPASATPTLPSTPPATAAATPSPTLSPSPTPTGAAPTAVRFIDALHGWVGTDDGIVGTADGGATWDRQLTAGSITKLWAYDWTHAWALAGVGTLYRTRDGSHWTAVLQPPTPPIAEIDAFSPDLLWAIGVPAAAGPQPAQRIGNVMRSVDGGATWQMVGTHTMWSVCFDTATDGIGAEGKQVFRTADAGRTWFAIATLAINDDGPYWYPTLACPNGTNVRLQVIEPNAALGHAPYLVYRTNDAGRTWVLEFREGYTLGTTTPPNTPSLGTYPSIFGAFTGGQTWFITCSPPTDSQEFLVLGPSGETLARGPVPIAGCARAGQVLDQAHVVAVSGASASVIASDNGGGTWRTIYRGRTGQ